MRGENKDRVTEDLRKALGAGASFLTETERADLSLINLAFHSTVHPDRHVWIDTKAPAPRFISIDLEDWTFTDTWDNAVATVDVGSAAVACEVIWSWLRGDTLDETLQRATDATIVRK